MFVRLASASHSPTGAPQLSNDLRAKVRRDNKMFVHSVLRCHLLHTSNKFFALENIWSSWGWIFPEAKALKDLTGVFDSTFSMCCFGGPRKRWTRVLHNSTLLAELLEGHQCSCVVGPDSARIEGDLSFPTSDEDTYPVSRLLQSSRSLHTAGVGRTLAAARRVPDWT
jgi:hypothetical protein